MYKVRLLILFVFIFQQQRGQSIHQTDIIVKQLMDSAAVTGICIGMIRDNKVLYTRAYGYRIKERNLLNDTSTCFYAASLSKAVFAYLIMELVEKGVISLDTPIVRYLPKPLPDYDNYKDLAGDDRWKQITPAMCLSHTTGFPNWRQFNPNDNKKLEIFFTPGSRYAYSGEGINLLQMVVETITGRSLEDLAKEMVFIPLGMSRTGYIWHPEFESDFALGYDEKGWGLYSTSAGIVFFKEGHDDGWVHYSIGIPSAGRALVIMCNSSNGEKIFNRLCEKLLGVTIPWQWEGYSP